VDEGVVVVVVIRSPLTRTLWIWNSMNVRSSSSSSLLLLPPPHRPSSSSLLLLIVPPPPPPPPPSSSLLLPHGCPCADHYKAGKGPDPKQAKLDKEMDDYWKSKK